MKNKNFLIILTLPLLLFLVTLRTVACEYELKHVDPPMWWTGMNNTELQLMVHGDQIADLTPEIVYPGITIRHVTRTSNNNYLFITLDISGETKPGTVNIDFMKGKKRLVTHPYTLNEREEGS
ncbi:MAG: cyclomaltodextrinase N-terminal domain-containing protein, partial [Bacteroidales bacterium]|nr:cyclomaltodextrinase N-terminal domain-containing protein [Bacteroidales bacterium]